MSSEQIRRVIFRRTLDADQQWALTHLRARLRRGKRVYTLISHVSRSGMSRSVRVFAVYLGRLEEYTGPAATLLGRKVDARHYGIRVGGCGFDAGSDVVHALALALHGRDAGYSLNHERL